MLDISNPMESILDTP